MRRHLGRRAAALRLHLLVARDLALRLAGLLLLAVGLGRGRGVALHLLLEVGVLGARLFLGAVVLLGQVLGVRRRFDLLVVVEVHHLLVLLLLLRLGGRRLLHRLGGCSFSGCTGTSGGSSATCCLVFGAGARGVGGSGSSGGRLSGSSAGLTCSKLTSRSRFSASRRAKTMASAMNGKMKLPWMKNERSRAAADVAAQLFLALLVHHGPSLARIGLVH
jgi:hypothetical protein